MENKIVYRSKICSIELDSLLLLVENELNLHSLTDDQLRRVIFDVNDDIEMLQICKRLLRQEVSDRHISLYSDDNE